MMSSETRAIEVYEIILPEPFSEASNRVVKDSTGGWFIDPLLMGVSVNYVTCSSDGVTYCTIDGETFADIEWLAENFQSHRTVFEVDVSGAARAYKRLFIELAEMGPYRTGRTVFHTSEDVFSEH